MNDKKTEHQWTGDCQAAWEKTDCRVKYGQGWYNSDERRCGALGLGYEAKCSFEWPHNRGMCCSGDYSSSKSHYANCPHEWTSPISEQCSPINRELIKKTLSQDLPFPSKASALWAKSRAGDYERVREEVCPKLVSFRQDLHDTPCQQWCLDPAHTPKCQPSAVATYCTYGDRAIHEPCQKIKGILDPIYRIPIWEAEYEFCKGDERFRTQQCINFANDDILLRDGLGAGTKAKYDQLWQEFCPEVKKYIANKPTSWKPKNAKDLEDARIQCACYGDPDDEDKDVRARRDCFNTNCAGNPATYRPSPILNPNRIGCPNVCAVIINARAGGSNIIKNINIFQNCFGNAKEFKQIREQIEEAIQKDIAENLKTLLRLYFVTDREMPKTFVDYAQKHNIKFDPKYVAFYNEVANHIAQYDDLAKAFDLIREIRNELREKVNPAVSSYTALVKIEWDKSIPEEEMAKKYLAAKNKFAESLHGVATSLDHLEPDIIDVYEQLKKLRADRASRINRMLQKVKDSRSIIDALDSKVRDIDEFKEISERNKKLNEQLRANVSQFKTRWNVQSEQFEKVRDYETSDKKMEAAFNRIAQVLVELNKEVNEKSSIADRIIADPTDSEEDRKKLIRKEAEEKLNEIRNLLGEYEREFSRVSLLESSRDLSSNDAETFKNVKRAFGQSSKSHRGHVEDLAGKISLAKEREVMEELLKEFNQHFREFQSDLQGFNSSLKGIKKKTTPDDRPGPKPKPGPVEPPSRRWLYIALGLGLVGVIAFVYFSTSQKPRNNEKE